MMFPHTITVYNKYVDDGAEKWQRTILTGVFFDGVKGAVMRKTGVASADSLQIIIPMSVQASRAAYAPSKAWTTLTDKTGSWTLQNGDTVVYGALDYEIIKSSKELQNYDDVFIITGVDTKQFGADMAHWEVSAK
jgi:hypothetical protein